MPLPDPPPLPPTPPPDRDRALRLARFTRTGVVTVVDGSVSYGSYPNSYVPPGQEVVLDLAPTT